MFPSTPPVSFCAGLCLVGGEMGSVLSRGVDQQQQKPGKVAEKMEPQLDSATVDRLCREAYAAGAFESSAHHQAILESQWRTHVAAGVGGCAAMLLLSYMYFSTQMVQKELQAEETLEKGRALVLRLQEENGETRVRMEKLLDVHAQQKSLVARHKMALHRMRRRQTRLTHTLASVRRKNASLVVDMTEMRASLTHLKHRVAITQYCGGAVALGCLAAASVTLLMAVWGRTADHSVAQGTKDGSSAAPNDG